MARLTSIAEREALARSLRQALADLHRDRPAFSSHIPVHPQRLAICRDVVDDITLRLHAPQPVRARGMARLRILLSDGTGPLYRSGRAAWPPDCAECWPPSRSRQQDRGPAIRPSTRSVRARSACPSGYSGVVTSMRWRPAKARNSRASARVFDETDRT